MTKACINTIMPGEVYFYDNLSDLPTEGKEKSLYVVRSGTTDKEKTTLYEFIDGEYVLLDVTDIGDIDFTAIEEKIGAVEKALEEHSESIVSDVEVHGIKYQDEKLLIRLPNGDVIEFTADGEAIIDEDYIKKIAKELVDEHEKKTVFKDRVHGMRIDGGILEYWDHTTEEWVELFSSEFQSFPRVKNLSAKSNDYGNAIIVTFENPAVASYKRTEVYISDTDITSSDRDQIAAIATKIIDDGTTTKYEHAAVLGTLYYVVAYAVHEVEGETHYSNMRSVSALAQDETPPGDVTDIKVKVGSEVLELTWKNPSDADFAKTRGVYKKGSPPTTMDDGTVFSDGSVEAATLTGLENEQEYYIRFYTVDLNGNVNDNESMIVSATPKEGGGVGPGGDDVVAGDSEYGFFGEVPSSDLWTGSQLSNLLGITQGTLQHSNEPWLKFVLDGKIIYKSKKPFRHSISWNHLNEKNAVFGNKVIEDAQGNQYKVRLMKGALTDPSQSGASDRGAKYSEWNKLMLPIHEQAKNKNWAYPAYVESEIPANWNINYTDKDLVTISSAGNGSYQWCQETPATSPPSRVIRGDYGVSYAGWTTASSSHSGNGWSPVLELL